MSGPWEKYATQSDGPWSKYQAQEQPVTTSAAPDLPKGFTIGGLPLVSDKGVWADVKRSFGLAGRSALNAVTSLPLAAANFGVGARNLITGEQNELPSTTWNQSLTNAGLPEASGKLEKTADFINQVVVGSKLPAPEAAQRATPQYSTAQPVRDATLKASQEAGYVVPPSTTNPTMSNKIMESVGGKIATAQDAAAQNADITNALAKKTLGLHPDAPLTQGALDAVRSEASPAYEAIKQAGTMQSDPAYEKALDALVSKYQGAGKSFPGLVNDQVSKLVESLKQPTFEADSAVDATKVLRESASKAYSQGDKALGSAYRTASNELEDLMERNLAKGGADAAKTLQNFRDARQLIAKTYSVDKALNPDTGNVSAVKLAQLLAKGKPLSDELKTAAQFGRAFPKAAQSITDSGSVRNTDMILGAGTSAMSHDPKYLLYPFLRMAMRKGLLSKAGQSLAVPSGPRDMSSTAMGASQALSNALLGQ